MNDIEIINHELGTNYNNFNEIYDMSEALSICIKNKNLYKYISRFNSDAWTYNNQGLFADIFDDYVKIRNSAFRVGKIINPDLLTKAYKFDWKYMYAGNVCEEALNEENIKLAIANSDVSFISNFRNSPLVLNIFLKSDCEIKMDFFEVSWTDENIKLYVRKLIDESLKNKLYSFYSLKGGLKEIINQYQFNVIDDFYLFNFKLDDEIGELLYQRMIEKPELIISIKNIKGIEAYYLKALIVSKRYDLINKVHSSEALNSENELLLADNLEEYLNFNNNELVHFCFKSDVILHKLLELKKFDIVKKFGNQVWNEENIKLLFNQFNDLDENLKSDFKNIFYNSERALKVYCIENYAFNINFNSSCWTEENIELYFEYLKRNNRTTLIHSFINIPNYSNRCLEHNILKYLNVGYDDIDYDLLCRKIIELPDEEFNISSNRLINHPEVTCALIDSKRYSFLNMPFLTIDDRACDKFCDSLEEYFSEGYEKIPFPFANSTMVLKKIIELEKYEFLSTFSSKWDKETITMIINKYLHDVNLGYYQLTALSERYFQYGLRTVDSRMSLSNYYNYKEYKDPFFRYLEEKNMYDVYYLINYYKEIGKIDDYIRDGYITDKFRRDLIFTNSYQMFCKDNNFDILSGVEDLCLLSYLKCCYQVSNLHRYIFINDTNYKYYFDECGPKQTLYDDLYNQNSFVVIKDLVEFYPSDKITPLMKYAINKFSSIENFRTRGICFQFFKDNYNIMNQDKVNELMEIVFRVEYSNSMEMHSFSEQIISAILTSHNPIEKLNKIEKIFLKDDVPMFAKSFICFKTLYPNLKKTINEENIFNFNENSRISPELLKANPNDKRMQMFKKIVNGDETEIRFQIIFNDLLYLAINSNNESLVKYLDNLKKGNDYFNKVINNDFNLDILNQDEYKILEKFVTSLSTVYENMTDKSLKAMNFSDKCSELIKYFKPSSNYQLADRIVRTFGYFAGFDSLEQIINTMKEKEKIVSIENQDFGRYLENNIFKLKDGDLLRCIGNFSVVGSSLENGNVCKELLGSLIGKSESDTTPLDVDFTYINVADNIYNSIDGTPTGWGFGNVFMVLKDDYVINRDGDGNIFDNEYDVTKLEAFGTNGYKDHWAVRSGVARTNIKCFIYKKINVINPEKPYNDDGSVNYLCGNYFDDLPSIKFEIVRNGLYIPIVDMSGKLIFTVDEYNYMRSKMNGLSKYNCSEYKIDEETLYFDGINELVDDIKKGIQRVSNVRKAIYQRVEDIILNPDNGFDIKKINNSFDGSLTSGNAELLETGSTARFSNIPNDSDFDFILNLDRQYIINYEETKKIIDILRSELKPQKIISTEKNRFRGTGISISGFDDLDIDISLEQRTNASGYCSENALNDRYESIKKQHPDRYLYVLANIIKAKQLLSDVGAYKKNDGGMGGIGVENWILQNGGSLEKACIDFMTHAYDSYGNLKDFDEFKKSYYVFDFGSNHEPREKIKNVFYSFDNYIEDNMSKSGYEKMAHVLKKYLDELDILKKNTNYNY